MLEYKIGNVILSGFRLMCDCSTPRQQAQEPEQQQAVCQQLIEADAPSIMENNSYLPLDVLELVVAQLPHQDCAAARLVSSAMCQLVDHTIQSLRIKDLENTIHRGEGKWCSVRQLDVQAEPGWALLLCSLHTLPHLQHLRICTRIDEPMSAHFAQSLAGLTRLDLGRADAELPAGIALTSLRAISFGSCFSRHLKGLAAFAPRLEQLYCERLSVASSAGVALPCCTHFGASQLSVVGDGAADGNSSHALFPNLKVLFRLPEMSSVLGTQPLMALAPPACYEAVQGHGALLNSSLKGQLVQMSNLKRLSLHNPLGSGMAGFQAISAFTQLQHLRITGSTQTTAVYADYTASALLRALQRLPQLQSLALPAQLLCCYCSPGVAVDSFVALCSTGRLQALVFLQLKPAGPTMERPHRRFKGCECPHKHHMLERLRMVQKAVAAALAGFGSGRRVSVHIQTGDVWPDHFPWMNNHAAGGSVWGVYGTEECW